MAIVFQTSFDHYTTITQRWTSVSGSGHSISAGNGRNGSASLRFPSANTTSNGISATLPAGVTDIYHAFAYRQSFLPLNKRTIAALRDNASFLVQLILRADGLLEIRRGGNDTTEGTLISLVSDFSLLTNVYYHFEWHIGVSATVGVVGFRVNEVEKLSLTNQNTGTGTVTNIRLVNTDITTSSGGIADFDDVVVRDDTWNGDVQVRSFLPTGIGATNQWTAVGAATTREAVDEAAPNSDTDYIEEVTVNDLSLFTYDTIPTTAEIRAVIPLPFAKKSDAGTAKIKSTVRLSSTNYDGAEKAPSDSSYEYHPDILMVSPDTGVAFTPAEWNAPIEIGPKRTA